MLAIPSCAILKIIFDSVAVTKPYGMLLGEVAHRPNQPENEEENTSREIAADQPRRSSRPTTSLSTSFLPLEKPLHCQCPARRIAHFHPINPSRQARHIKRRASEVAFFMHTHEPPGEVENLCPHGF